MPKQLKNSDIVKFRTFVDSYDYSQLRAINCSTEKDTAYRASPEGIRAFLIGCAVLSEITISKHNNLDTNLVLAMGDALLALRDRIYQSEMTYHQNIREFPDDIAHLHSTLKSSNLWVIYFHYTIEQQLEEGALAELKGDYRIAVKAIQSIGVSVFAWLLEMAPELSAKYAVLGTDEQQAVKAPKENALNPNKALSPSSEATEGRKRRRIGGGPLFPNVIIGVTPRRLDNVDDDSPSEEFRTTLADAFRPY